MERVMNLFVVQNDLLVEPLEYISNIEINRVVNGAFFASFATFNSSESNAGYAILVEEAIVTIDGFDFKVKQLEETRYGKTVTATSTFFELTNQRQDAIYGGTHTFNEFATFVLNGTGWTYTSDIEESRLIANYGNANVITLINALCTEFNCEYEIRKNNVVHFTSLIGGDNDAQYRYKHNVGALSKKVDTSKLKTQITGYGANGLVVTYTSPNAENPLFGIKKADPITDEKFFEASDLLAHLKSQLDDVPEAYFEMDTIELTSKELGERVWLIYEPLNIEFQTRVLEQTKTIRDGKFVTSKVVLGNKVPQTNADLFASVVVEIDENKKDYRSKFEQTNERITLEVEAVNESIATIELQADEIKLSVEALDESIATLTIEADEIQLNVSAIDSRLGTAESNISVQAGQISQRVSYTDYNGYTVASMLNQTATTISLSAQMIDLLGITNVASALFVGTQGSMEEKGIYFRDNASIYSPNGTGEFHIENLGGYTYIYNHVIFGTPYGGSTTVDFNQANVVGLYPTFG